MAMAIITLAVMAIHQAMMHRKSYSLYPNRLIDWMVDMLLLMNNRRHSFFGIRSNIIDRRTRRRRTRAIPNDQRVQGDHHGYSIGINSR
jgi:hypothetical protein